MMRFSLFFRLEISFLNGNAVESIAIWEFGHWIRVGKEWIQLLGTPGIILLSSNGNQLRVQESFDAKTSRRGMHNKFPEPMRDDPPAILFLTSPAQLSPLCYSQPDLHCTS